MSDQPFSAPESAPPGDGRGTPALPHHREAEEAVLGSVLLQAEVFFELAHILTADAFFLHRNRWIWEAFTGLQEQRLPIDILTVSEELERQDRLSETGGPAYLTALINNVPTTLHAVAYARLVEEIGYPRGACWGRPTRSPGWPTPPTRRWRTSSTTPRRPSSASANAA